MNLAERRGRFRELHESGCFVMPNPWDRGSAVALASLGFPALATSSAALGYSLGRLDLPGSIGTDDALAHVHEIVGATALPVNVDFQNGYGASASEVAEHVASCVARGAAGLSIEDASEDPAAPLFDRSEAIDRFMAAREVTGPEIVLTGRCEAFLVGAPDPLETAIDRLVAFAEAGADCLYAPGLQTPEQVSALVEAVAPKPVNVLASVGPEWMTVESLANLGVRRITLGSSLSKVAWTALLGAAREVADSGLFSRLRSAHPVPSLDDIFGTDS
ncbi:MAG: isocitrate lyase/phosphoenolpyruvate mutase family protein [Planctomycetota bacterium]